MHCKFSHSIYAIFSIFSVWQFFKPPSYLLGLLPLPPYGSPYIFLSTFPSTLALSRGYVWDCDWDTHPTIPVRRTYKMDNYFVKII